MPDFLKLFGATVLLIGVVVAFAAMIGFGVASNWHDWRILPATIALVLCAWGTRKLWDSRSGS